MAPCGHAPPFSSPWPETIFQKKEDVNLTTLPGCKPSVAPQGLTLEPQPLHKLRPQFSQDSSSTRATRSPQLGCLHLGRPSTPTSTCAEATSLGLTCGAPTYHTCVLPAGYTGTTHASLRQVTPVAAGSYLSQHKEHPAKSLAPNKTPLCLE